MIIIREILFKAKCISNKEWIEGYFSKHPKGECTVDVILNKCKNPPDSDPMWERVLISYEVDLETTCQYIGKTDKNGKKIWEHDIVKTNSGRLCRVVWFSSPQYQGWDLIPLESINPAPSKNNLWSEIEVVGNIFDNPELLNVNQ